MSAVLVFVLFAAVPVGLGLLLYTLVRSEHDRRETMDRQDAERAVRRDRDDRRR